MAPSDNAGLCHQGHPARKAGQRLWKESARKTIEQVKFRKDYERKLKQVKGNLKEIEKVIRGRKI